MTFVTHIVLFRYHAFFPGGVFMIIVKKCARIGSPEEIVKNKITAVQKLEDDSIITWAKCLRFVGT